MAAVPSGMDHFRPGAAATTCSTVEISVSCKNLINMDVLSKSDPMCVLFVKEFGRNEWVEFGRTETIWNNLNPEWTTKFLINYFFEERQFLKFEIYDIDSESRNLKDHDFLGRLECTMGEIVSQAKCERPLADGPRKNSGLIISKIIVAAEEIGGCKEELTFKFEAKKLDKKDWFGKSDPYLAFYRANEDGTYTVVHRTEVIKNTLNPAWKEFTISARAFCGGDYNRSILVKCFDWNKSGKEDLIGEFVTNVQDMSKVKNGQAANYELNVSTTPNVKKKKVGGQLVLSQFSAVKVYTFVDHIQAGTQLNCTIAIDFTASNGAPTQPTSLHYIHPHIPNQYARALTAVGEIIQDYDSDQLFPVLGFGARLPPDGRVSHEFFVNGQANNPYCQGIPGVLAAYQNCLMNVQLYGPTNFAPCINHVARFAATKRDGSEYFILLIITDGIITDMPQTKEAIVSASTLPLSIIIVGVGQADFGAMNELDGDEVRLSSNGRFADRDIVQFVPFRDFINSSTPADMQVSQARLAKEVLAEIPEQFVSYMKKSKIAPGSFRPKNAAVPPPPIASSGGGGGYPNIQGQAPSPPPVYQQQQPQQSWYPAASAPPPYPSAPGR